MRVHRVLVPSPIESAMTLRGPEAHHLRDVLRVKPGAEVEAFDGRGSVAHGRVSGVSREGVMLELGEPRRSAVEPDSRVTVAVALLKGDKLADVIRRCTELGVNRFVLLKTQHADVTDLSDAKRLRLLRVAEEATRQSGRALVPSVDGPVPLKELAWDGTALVADPRAARALTPSDLPAPDVTLVTGPEGGLAAAEVDALVDRGAVALNLGPRILRAETAPVALCAVGLLSSGVGVAGAVAG